MMALLTLHIVAALLSKTVETMVIELEIILQQYLHDLYETGNMA